MSILNKFKKLFKMDINETESVDLVKDPNQKELDLGFDDNTKTYYNYRVLAFQPENKEQSFFGVFEAEYNVDGDIIGYSEEPVELVGGSKDDLVKSLSLFNEALAKDVIIIKEEEDDTRSED
jgi:hypothetical protein|tara:strand:- start:277 stop:642 length:366 start_codon:yes stop_codon:yes gene_type:complete